MLGLRTLIKYFVAGKYCLHVKVLLLGSKWYLICFKSLIFYLLLHTQYFFTTAAMH